VSRKWIEGLFEHLRRCLQQASSQSHHPSSSTRRGSFGPESRRKRARAFVLMASTSLWSVRLLRVRCYPRSVLLFSRVQLRIRRTRRRAVRTSLKLAQLPSARRSRGPLPVQVTDQSLRRS
jgi:hypothetical protein